MKKQRQRKLILDNSELVDEFFEEVKLIAIVSPLPSYQFIWNLNREFPYKFKRDHENEIECKDVFYTVYSFFDSFKLIEHYLFSNRHLTDYLLPEAKNIDFIWMIKGGHAIFETQNSILSLLSTANFIDHCFDLNTTHLPSKQHLIL